MKEVIEVLTGKRGAGTVSLGAINGAAVNDYSLVDQVAVVNGLAQSAGVYYANAYADFATCIDNLNANGLAGASIIVSSEQIVNASVDASAYHVLAIGDGKFTGPAAVTLTLGDFEAQRKKVFYSGITVAGLHLARPEWWGAMGDGVTDDTAALSSALKCGIDSRAPVYLGGVNKVYLTTAEIALTLDADYPGYYHIYGDGATILNTSSNVLSTTGGTHHLKIEGIRFIGSSDSYATRSSYTGVSITNCYNVEIRRCEFSGFAIGFTTLAALWSRLEGNTFSYNGHHCYLNNNSASVNVCEVKDNIFWVGKTAGDVGSKTLATDKALTVYTSANTRVIHNTFEFPQAYGIHLNRNRAAVIESNYFEHGSGGYDIFLDGTASYGYYNRYSGNYHNAGSGDGDTSGGHKPFTSSTTNRYIALGNYVNGYHADNIVAGYADDTITLGVDTLNIGTADSTLAMNYSVADLYKESVFSRRKSISATTTSDMFKITGIDESSIGVEITAYNGRNTTGADGGIIKAYATLYCTGTTMAIVNDITQSNAVGTGFTWDVTVSGADATFTCANGTGNEHWVAYEVKMLSAETTAGVRSTIAEL